MSIMVDDELGKIYCGDVLVSGGGSGGDIPVFNGYVKNGTGGIMIPYSKTEFNTSKSFDIIFCFWLGTNPTAISGAAFGTSLYNWYTYYPSVEITVGENPSVWYGVSDDVTYGWTLANKRVDCVFTENSFNYVKLSYSTVTNLITLSHSINGRTWNVLDSVDITGRTIVNSTDEVFCFGCNGQADRLIFPAEDDFHIAIDKCKIISEGVTIFGYDD